MTTTSRDLVIKTLNHEPTPRIAHELVVMPGVRQQRGEELEEIYSRFPSDTQRVKADVPGKKSAAEKRRRGGDYVDAWGCTWNADQEPGGVRLVQPALPSARQIDQFQPPWELASGARFDKVNRLCDATSQFVLGQSDLGLLSRLQALRGTSPALTDLARGTKRIRHLLEMVHDFNCRTLSRWAESNVDGILIGDDFSGAESVLIGAGMWRELLKPLYRDYVSIVQQSDKFLLFEAGGDLSSVLDDLVALDLDAIHADLTLLNVDKAAGRHRGAVTFVAEIDRAVDWAHQPVDDVRRAVLQLRRSLDFGSGGVIAHCRWTPEMPLRHVAAMLEQWLAPLPMHA